MARHTLSVFADYRQFYVWDSATEPSAPEDYSPDDTARRVKVTPNVIVVQPARSARVPVELHTHSADPGFEISAWDHIVECSLDLPSGSLQVHESTGTAKLDLALTPGTYVARVLFAGLDTLSNDALQGEDHYRVDLWPGEARALFVAKAWPPKAPS